ncbi:MAG: RHS repeat domain-containing protein, partial [Gammaproteobacteria bacterium]
NGGRYEGLPLRSERQHHGQQRLWIRLRRPRPVDGRDPGRGPPNPPAAQIATHYLYDPEGRLLGEYDQAGRVEREYVYLDGLPLAQITGTAIAYLHTDHLGTPESLTDQDQAIVWQAHHDPFGRATVTTQAVEHNLRFPGQYFDAETGLHYNYFRDYDPSIGEIHPIRSHRPGRRYQPLRVCLKQSDSCLRSLWP